MYLSSVLLIVTSALLALGVQAENGEAFAKRDYFMVGGNYVNTSAGHLFVNQMYVEHLTPETKQQLYPVIFIHGQGQDGSNFLNKPDGSRGWASWFLNEGYEVYIIDQTMRGRSAWWPSSGVAIGTYAAEIIQQRFTAIKDYMLWPQASLHTQWPGTGRMGDAVFDAFYSSNVQFASDTLVVEKTMQAAGAALLDKIGSAILLSHSQGGLMPWLWADARPNLVKAIVSIEPTGPPFQDAVFSTTVTRPYGLTNIPLTFSPSVDTTLARPIATNVLAASNETAGFSCTVQADPPRKLVNIAKVPVLVETSEASYHAVYDKCTALFLEQAGVNVTFLNLRDVGIHGNGHMQFMEKNSDDIAAVLHAWIKKSLVQ
ncbi:hypothetical protein PVAG01_08205 [Phlyctema vagabunda]|uniref:AB hydrolase-1 domain-containing protein n=1 Tax=Phlyctema vagabunda TaxID=108571 RepID=A0ABR4P957_9HELO